MPFEIVKLPVPAGTEDDVVEYLKAAPYFRQTGLRSHQILVGVDDPEVALILEWDSREVSKAAIETDIGKEFLAGLEPRLAGAPQLAYYEPR
jgi:hypothetical protein